MVGMTSVGVDWGWSIFMGIAFFNFVGRSRWMDAIEAVDVRGRDGVMV